MVGVNEVLRFERGRAVRVGVKESGVGPRGIALRVSNDFVEIKYVALGGLDR